MRIAIEIRITKGIRVAIGVPITIKITMTPHVATESQTDMDGSTRCSSLTLGK
jgi:hypothetical protein